MKKVMYLFGFSVLCLFGLESFGGYEKFEASSFLNNGELPVLTTSVSGGGNNPEIIWDGCDFTYQVVGGVDTLYLANLIMDGAFSGSYPPDAPILYHRVTLFDGLGNEDSQIMPVFNWQYIGNFGPADEPVFKAIIHYGLALNSWCESNGAGPDVTLTLRHELLEYFEPTATYIPYPACNLNDVGEVYSCKVFTEVPCDGEFPAGVCNSIDYTNSLTVLDIIDCSLCSFEKNESETYFERSELFIVKVSPNPFEGEVILTWEENTVENRSAFLYNSFGEQVAEIKINEEKGRVVYNTSNLSKGIYFLAYTNNEGMKVTKLVKQ